MQQLLGDKSSVSGQLQPQIILAYKHGKDRPRPAIYIPILLERQLPLSDTTQFNPNAKDNGRPSILDA